MELLAVEGEDFASVAEDTEYFRTEDLPKKYIVIENVDKFVYCLNTVDGHNVISWDDITKQEVESYTTFGEYLQDSFQEAIYNW